MAKQTSERHLEVTRSLARALAAIDAIAAAERPLGVTEIANRIDVHKSSVYRLLRTLVEFDYLEQQADQAYWLGSRFAHLGPLSEAHLQLPRLARPHAERLSQLTRETVNLVKLQGNACLYLISIPTEQSIGMIARPPGATDAPHCTAVGKAMLAFLPPERAEALLSGPLARRTPHTLTTREAVTAQFDNIRGLGYAVDDRENDENVRCIGAPIFDEHNAVAGAVSISAPSFRLQPEQVPAVAQQVLACARDITRVLAERA